MTSLTVRGDVASTYLNIGEATGKAQSVTVTGDVNGARPASWAIRTGTIRVYATSTGTLKIGGSVVGLGDPQQGAVYVDSPSIGSVTIKGSLIGGTAIKSGVCCTRGRQLRFHRRQHCRRFWTGERRTLRRRLGEDDLRRRQCDRRHGGRSGLINVGGVKVNTLTIGGSIVGGTTHATGYVAIGSADSGEGSIVGGQGTNASFNIFTGGLLVDTDLKTLVVGGDLVAGTYNSVMKIGYNGTILVGGNLGNATIKGSILGHDGYHAILMAGGKATATPGNYTAMANSPSAAM